MDQVPAPSPSSHLEPAAVEGRRLGSDARPHLEPTGEGGPPGPSALPHRVYENTSADGHSRNMYGDVHNTYHVHSQGDSDAPEDDVAERLMNTLAFEEMNTRLATISTAHADTCQWLFAREEYTSWRGLEALRKHHGFLWIKGKPGAGKSTLMKCARQYGRDTHEDLTISFFFNARGGDLARSAEGMYRSLLYQLLGGMPDLAPSLGDFTQRSTKQSWPLATLEDMLATAVGALGKKAVTCYIDALDECDDEDARKMIEHFETLGQCAVKADTQFRVLLSSRHYPHIFLDRCLELHLEVQKEHGSDIAEYIRCKLKISEERLALELRDDIRARASGVFLWVVLVVGILNKYDARGKTRLLKKRLATIPDGLSKLFEELLQRSTDDFDETLLALQLVLFAQRPLRLDELYNAVVADSSDDAISETDHDEITSDVMERFLLDASKGLAELTKGSHPTVQFIHESVREYLLGKGLALIHPGLSENLVSISHERLRDCCLHYLEKSQAAVLSVANDDMEAHMSGQQWRFPANHDNNQIAAAYPFLGYAIEGIMYHAGLAHSTGRPQNKFVADFPHEIWRKLGNAHHQFKRLGMKTETQPLYTFVVMGALELARIEIQDSSSHVESRLEGEKYPTLLDVAVNKKDQRMLDLLLENGAIPNEHAYPPASSCLFLAITLDNPAMVRSLLDYGAGPFCVENTASKEPVFVESLLCALGPNICGQGMFHCLLTRAPYSLMSHWPEVFTDILFLSRSRGFQSIERLLLTKMESLVNNLTSSKASITIEELGDAFVAACENRQVVLVKVLIEHGVLQASNQIAQAFRAAVHIGCDEVIQTLLESGVDVDMRLDDFGTTALDIAIFENYANTVGLLLDRGAKASPWCIALRAAAVQGHGAIKRMLLDACAAHFQHSPRPS